MPVCNSRPRRKQRCSDGICSVHGYSKQKSRSRRAEGRHVFGVLYSASKIVFAHGKCQALKISWRYCLTFRALSQRGNTSSQPRCLRSCKVSILRSSTSHPCLSKNISLVQRGLFRTSMSSPLLCINIIDGTDMHGKLRESRTLVCCNPGAQSPGK